MSLIHGLCRIGLRPAGTFSAQGSKPAPRRALSGHRSLSTLNIPCHLGTKTTEDLPGPADDIPQSELYRASFRDVRSLARCHIMRQYETMDEGARTVSVRLTDGKRHNRRLMGAWTELPGRVEIQRIRVFLAAPAFGPHQRVPTRHFSV